MFITTKCACTLLAQRSTVRINSPYSSPNGQNADNDVKLLCQIFTFVFEEVPEYLALSYACGDTRVTNELQCDGGPLMKTMNLEAALTQLFMSPFSEDLV